MGSVEMPSPVTQRSPEDGVWKTVFQGVWWVLTSLPFGESYNSWLQLRHPINLHKGLSFLWCILCMHLSGHWTYPACIYTALHGSYGILWLTKEALYRDASWESPCTGGSALFLFFGMAIAFWSNIVLLVTGGSEYEPSPAQLSVIATVFIFGNWLHHCADVQKYFVLRARKGLITDGFFSKCRNPNYLGEMMIYGSFGGKMWLHFIRISMITLILSIRMEPSTVVVPLGVVGDSVDLLVLPLLAGQGQVHVKVPSVVPVHLSFRLDSAMAILIKIIWFRFRKIQINSVKYFK